MAVTIIITSRSSATGTSIPELNVSGQSTRIAILSIIPVSLAIIISVIWRALHVYLPGAHRPRTWRPTLLRPETHLILLGLMLSFIMLLEAASMGIPSTDASSTSHSATRVANAMATMPARLGVPTTTPQVFWPSIGRLVVASGESDPSTTGAPPPSVGWLSQQTPTPTPSEPPGAPPPSVGWLSQQTPTPTPTLPPTTAPPPSFGWLTTSSVSAESQYFIGTFLPTLLASLFAIPFTILYRDARSLEPFAQLARPGGATARQSLFLRYRGDLHAVLTLLRAPLQGQTPVALAAIVSQAAALLNPLAAESVVLRLHGPCLADWTAHCTASLAVSQPVVYATQAVLAVMAAVTAALIYLLSWPRVMGRDEGYGPLQSDPRSIVGVASLAVSSGPELKTTLRPIGDTTAPRGDGMLRLFDSKVATGAMGDVKFKFNADSLNCGIVAVGACQHSISHDHEKIGAERGTQNMQGTFLTREKLARSTSIMLLLIAKVVLFTMYLAGLAGLILYYRLTYENTGFERFMDAQSTFGVRFLFNVFGLLVGLGWGSIFQDLAGIYPFWNMARRPSKAEDSVLMPLAPNQYIGFKRYLNLRNALLTLVSLAAITGDFLPILLSNVPFNNAATFATHVVCSWLSVCLLLGMLILLLVILARISLQIPSRILPFRAADLGTLGVILYIVGSSEGLLAQLEEPTDHGEVEKRIRAEGFLYQVTNWSDQVRGQHTSIEVAL